MTNPEFQEWTDTNEEGVLVSKVPEGKKGLALGMVPLAQGPSTTVFVIPAMDNDEVLKMTPHGGRTMVAVEVEGINGEDFKAVLSGAYMAYIGRDAKTLTGEGTNTTGAAPTFEQIKEFVPWMSDAKIKKIMASKGFRDACEVRGIAMTMRPGMTPKQDAALNIILDPSQSISLKERLRRARVPMAQYRAWMKQPQFRAYVEGLAGGMLKDFEADMMTSLVGLAVEGDREAIKYAFEMSGKHNPKQQDSLNVKEVMLQIISIIQRHVTDPETLHNIGNEIMLLTGAQQAATNYSAKELEQ